MGTYFRTLIFRHVRLKGLSISYTFQALVYKVSTIWTGQIYFVYKDIVTLCNNGEI